MSEKLICITNRQLCAGDFTARIAEIAAARPQSIILREKDLSDTEYQALAEQLIPVCKDAGVPLVLHSHIPAAAALHVNRLHLPLPLLRETPRGILPQFAVLGTSVHSPEEAQEAEALGADYLIAGHLFATDCKRGLPGRGLQFLQAVLRAVQIPVFGIGGITPARAEAVTAAGAAGVCVMSGLMQCADVSAEIEAFRRAMT